MRLFSVKLAQGVINAAVGDDEKNLPSVDKPVVWDQLSWRQHNSTSLRGRRESECACQPYPLAPPSGPKIHCNALPMRMTLIVGVWMLIYLKDTLGDTVLLVESETGVLVPVFASTSCIWYCQSVFCLAGRADWRQVDGLGLRAAASSTTL